MGLISFPGTRIGLVCDQSQGLFLFIESRPPSVLWQSSDPYSYGQLIACTIDINKFLYVATLGNLLVYQPVLTYLLSFGFELVNAIDVSSELINSVYGFVADQTTQTISMLVQTNYSTVLFRVINNNPNVKGYGFVIFDEWIGMIIGKDCINSPTPAFLIAYSYTNMITFLFDSFSKFVSATVSLVAQMVTPSVSSSYIFQGLLIATNSVTSLDMPLTITAWNPASYHIYTTRNTISGDGYNAPTNITLYLNSWNSLTYELYLPLSNYFSGHNIIFSTSLAPGSSENVQIATPPSVTFNGTFTFPTESPLVMTTLEFDGFMIVAVLSNNQVYLFDGYSQDANFTVLSVVSPSIRGYQVMQFTCVIQQYSDVSRLVVESQTANGIGGYNIVWDLFDISDPSEVLYESRQSFVSDELFGKLESQNATLYSLRRNSIATFFVQSSYGSGIIVESTTINATTLNIASFLPMKLSTEFGVEGLLVYEMTLGTINITSNYETYSYHPYYYPISPDPENVSLYSYSGSIYILDHMSKDGPLVSFSNDNIASYPNFPNVNYMSLQFSYNYFAALSMNEENLSVFVFNIQEHTFLRDLVTVVPLASVSAFSFFYLWNGIYTIYAYDGKTITRWCLGQESTNWTPVSTNVPTWAYLDFTMWTKVTFDFTELENQSSYNATIEITATSGFSGVQNSTSVSIWVFNQGTYIAKNSTYTSPSQLTSGAIITVTNETVPILIPEGYFAGSDITYAFAVNGNQGALIPSKVKCTPNNSLVCIESKEFLCQNCTQSIDFEVLDFAVGNGTMYTASTNKVVAMSLETEQNVTYNITQLFNATNSVCYMIAVVRGAEHLVVAMCEAEVQSLTSQSLILLNTSSSSQTKFPILEIAMRIFSLKAVYDPEVSNVKIFATDWARVLVYTLQNSQIIISSIISSQILDLYYVMTPTSVEYINDSYMLVADVTLGWIYVLERVSNPNYNYSVYQSVTGFTGYNNTNGVASLCLAPDGQSVFMLSEAAALYQYSLWNETGDLNLSQIALVPPVAGDLDQYLLYDTLITSNDGNYVLYPVFDGSNCRVRVVNMSAPFQSRIYTSTDEFCTILPNQYYSTGNVQILTENATDLTVAVSLAPSSNSSIFQVFVIRLQTHALIFPQFIDSALNRLITLQLFGLNRFSKASEPEFTVNFTT